MNLILALELRWSPPRVSWHGPFGWLHVDPVGISYQIGLN